VTLPHSNLMLLCQVIHFVRHGQGFHNLMADMYKARGIEWEQVSCHVGVILYFHLDACSNMTLPFSPAVYSYQGESVHFARNSRRSLDRKGPPTGVRVATSGSKV